MTETLERIRASLVGLRMPRALEALDHTVRQLERGQIGALEAIDGLLAEEHATRETRRIGVALKTARLTPPKTLESFDFTFIGEGACMDSFGRYYATGKTSVAIPCYGERALGQVADDEIVVALPPEELDRVIEGLDELAKSGFGYPIGGIGGFTDPHPFLAQVYPNRRKH